MEPAKPSSARRLAPEPGHVSDDVHRASPCQYPATVYQQGTARSTRSPAPTYTLESAWAPWQASLRISARRTVQNSLKQCQLRQHRPEADVSIPNCFNPSCSDIMFCLSLGSISFSNLPALGCFLGRANSLTTSTSATARPRHWFGARCIAPIFPAYL